MQHLLSIARLPASGISSTARAMARLSLLDWLAVAHAGTGQPASRIIRDLVAEEGGRTVATVIGSRLKAPPRAAALANGTTSHALDYDDTHFAHVGHLSVAIMPAALAAAEDVDAPISPVVDAFLLGAEAACRLGMALGRGHYEKGFHQTATSGAFGAAIAAGRIYGLSEDQLRVALSLVSTRASGLKSQFGTMGKPLNAGIAAANGIEAALLARRGFSSCDDGVSGPQGFIATHGDGSPDPFAWSDMPLGRFLFEDNTYKFHACCHGTHAMIEALKAAMQAHEISTEVVRQIEVTVNPRWLQVCDIKSPRSGLEVKFSYAHLAAMVLRGIDTAAETTYTDDLCASSGLIALAGRVTVLGNQGVSDTAAWIALETCDGRRIEGRHDISLQPELGELERRLLAKAGGLIGEAMTGTIWPLVLHGDNVSAARLLATLAVA